MKMVESARAKKYSGLKSLVSIIQNRKRKITILQYYFLRQTFLMKMTDKVIIKISICSRS